MNIRKAIAAGLAAVTAASMLTLAGCGGGGAAQEENPTSIKV